MILEDDEIAVAIPAELSQEIIEAITIIPEELSHDIILSTPKRFGIVDLWHIRNQKRIRSIYRN